MIEESASISFKESERNDKSLDGSSLKHPFDKREDIEEIAKREDSSINLEEKRDFIDNNTHRLQATNVNLWDNLQKELESLKSETTYDIARRNNIKSKMKVLQLEQKKIQNRLLLQKEEERKSPRVPIFLTRPSIIVINIDERNIDRQYHEVANLLFEKLNNLKQDIEIAKLENQLNCLKLIEKPKQNRKKSIFLTIQEKRKLQKIDKENAEYLKKKELLEANYENINNAIKNNANITNLYKSYIVDEKRNNIINKLNTEINIIIKIKEEEIEHLENEYNSYMYLIHNSQDKALQDVWLKEIKAIHLKLNLKTKELAEMKRIIGSNFNARKRIFEPEEQKAALQEEPPRHRNKIFADKLKDKVESLKFLHVRHEEPFEFKPGQNLPRQEEQKQTKATRHKIFAVLNNPNADINQKSKARRQIFVEEEPLGNFYEEGSPLDYSSAKYQDRYSLLYESNNRAVDEVLRDNDFLRENQVSSFSEASELNFLSGKREDQNIQVNHFEQAPDRNFQGLQANYPRDSFVNPYNIQYTDSKEITPVNSFNPSIPEHSVLNTQNRVQQNLSSMVPRVTFSYHNPFSQINSVNQSIVNPYNIPQTNSKEITPIKHFYNPHAPEQSVLNTQNHPQENCSYNNQALGINSSSKNILNASKIPTIKFTYQSPSGR